jgi:hypothetical protein
LLFLLSAFGKRHQESGDNSDGQCAEQHQRPGYGKRPEKKLEFDDLRILNDKNQHHGYQNDKYSISKHNRPLAALVVKLHFDHALLVR